MGTERTGTPSQMPKDTDDVVGTAFPARPSSQEGDPELEQMSLKALRSIRPPPAPPPEGGGEGMTGDRASALPHLADLMAQASEGAGGGEGSTVGGDEGDDGAEESDDGVVSLDVEDFAADPAATAPPPAEIADLASACVRFVAARYRATLDYSPETLSFVDQWVRDAAAETEQKRRAELIELVQSAAGAYLGEVIRRAFGGVWQIPDAETSSWRLCLASVYCAFNPIGMAREALLLEEAEGWHAHFELDPAEREGIEQRLAALPDVEPEEYYAPSTRFDVVAIVVDALRADMRAKGMGDVRFGPEDYA